MAKPSVLCAFITIIISAVILSNRLVSASIADNDVYDIEKDSICETQACIHEASFILGNMNSSADPCENFYEFACGKFVQETTIPDDKDQVNLFSITTDKIAQQISLRVSDKIQEDDQPPIKILKSYYQTCMDTDQIEKNSENDLQEILRQLGGCPALDGPSWDEEHFDWKKSVYEANKMGYDSDFFISVDVGIDPDNSTRRIITIDQTSSLLPRVHLIRDYSKFLVDFLHTFGIDKIQAEKEVNGAMDFRIELAEISLSRKDVRMSLHQLETKYVGIPWMEYINGILDPYAYLHRNEEVIIAASTFLKRFPELIANTPNRVLANHICFQTILQSIDYMGTRIFNSKSEVLKAFSNTKKPLPRREKCLLLALNHFSVPPFSKLYLRHYFDESSKTDAIHLTINLRNSLKHLIRQANWMDSATNLAAIEKLESMKAYVGYPDELDDNDKINELYGNITLHPRSFLRFEMSLHRFEKMIQYLQLTKPIDAFQWIHHSDVAIANAFYTLNANSFTLPAGILQGHFYNIDRPNYLNYGAIGTVIGHELSHAFDNEGSEYDKNGNLVNWWKNKTRKEYFDRVRCLIEQYGNYTIKEINLMINGILTQGENIADNVGVKAARYAYNKWAKKHEKELRLPGLRYTPHQMFWISYANNWCGKYRPERLKLNIKYDRHSSMEARVIGVLSNSRQFSKDFNCPLGSPMNPIEKCEFW